MGLECGDKTSLNQLFVPAGPQGTSRKASHDQHSHS